MRRHSPLPRPTLHDFLWATGIEDTFIAAPHPRTGRILDEYALTEHYDRWEEDLSLIADLGVSAARYGIPWHRVCPKPGMYDWTWTDKVLNRLVNTHGIEPIVDLVHYGTPLWMEQSFYDPDYPDHVADYARAFANQYRGLCYWYTPLNEPRVNAWYAGRLGWWPPYGRGWRAFTRLLVQLCRGICTTQRAIQEIEPDAVVVHVDASDLYMPADSGDSELVAESDTRQEIVFLAEDLVMGRVHSTHALREWLARMRIPDSEVDWFADNSVVPGVVGFNMYPMFSRKIVYRAPQGGIRVKIRPSWVEALAEIARLYANRYTPLPVMITETASSGSMNRRIRWIRESCETIRKLRSSGIPLLGYTFWPLFSLITWAYQKGARPLEDYLVHMGLWNLKPGPSGFERVPTAAVDAYKAAIAGTLLE